LSVTLGASDGRSDTDRKALVGLSQAVYSPSESANWPGRHLDWTKPEQDVFVVDDRLGLVSYVGAVVRNARHNTMPIRLGGIGAVKTHPDARGQGFAAAGLTKAMEFFGATYPAIDFALLVCNQSLLDYYARFGWREFRGELLTTQKGKTEVFTFNKVMVANIGGLAPTTGSIDLNGSPW